MEWIPDILKLPCGSVAVLDEESGISMRCTTCLCVVGSIGMPKRCKDEIQKWDQWQAIGGKNWEYRIPA